MGITGPQNLFLTLNEKQTTTEPVYVFSFVHTFTKTEVLFTKQTSDDKSFWPERYNQFVINPTELFTEPGEWHYKVTEQQSGEVLEQGILMMNKSSVFAYNKYHATTRYKAYRG